MKEACVTHSPSSTRQRRAGGCLLARTDLDWTSSITDDTLCCGCNTSHRHTVPSREPLTTCVAAVALGHVGQAATHVTGALCAHICSTSVAAAVILPTFSR